MKEDGQNWANPMVYPLLREHQRLHREYPTEAEEHLWHYIKSDQLGVRFRREHIIDDHIVDFVCLKQKLIIEVDGGYHENPLQVYRDDVRSADLEQLGFRVLRFTNDEVLGNIERVLNNITENLI